MNPLHAALYLVNTRLRLGQLARELGRPATFDDVPEADLEALADAGFDWVWWLGVWQTGEAGRHISRTRPEWQREFLSVLPDLTPEDVCGSCFAVQRYAVHRDFGGNAALVRLRRRLHRHGLRLMLDFVPNHTARDHPWVREHPEFYVRGTEEDLARAPGDYCRIDLGSESVILAHGRDPYFGPWPDTLQLDYADPRLVAAMRQQLVEVMDLCDGVRCDMAMLVLPDVFERTWGSRALSFWPEAIGGVRSRHPDAVLLAEVYWDLEWTLQQLGFDYTYDKRLYDRLRARDARAVRDHLRADLDYQRKSVRFLENHDELRAAAAFEPAVHRAAAVIALLCPGLALVHQGQPDGLRQRVPVHLGRGPQEPIDGAIRAFYDALLRAMRDRAVREGDWRLLDARPAAADNPTWDGFVCFAWEHPARRLLIIVNYTDRPAQCRLPLPWPGLDGRVVTLRDRLGPAIYERDGRECCAPGLFLDVPPWGHHVFEVTPAGP